MMVKRMEKGWLEEGVVVVLGLWPNGGGLLVPHYYLSRPNSPLIETLNPLNPIRTSTFPFVHPSIHPRLLSISSSICHLPTQLIHT